MKEESFRRMVIDRSLYDAYQTAMLACVTMQQYKRPDIDAYLVKIDAFSKVLGVDEKKNKA